MAKAQNSKLKMRNCDLFIEIGVEEIPVAELNPAVAYLSDSLKKLLEAEHISFRETKTFITPRRLVFSADGLSDKGEQSTTIYTGPRKEAAFDKEGKPTQAAIGFARSKGIDVQSLQVVRLDKGEFVQAEIKKPGIQTRVLIKQNLERIVLGIPFRKSMRWGDGTIRFIRPIRWLVVLYNGSVVPVSIGGVKASPYTQGLRGSHPGRLKVSGSASWSSAMKRGKILPEFDTRRKKLKEQAEALAKKAGGSAVPDIELLDTITNLVESPVAIPGSFDERFMNMPEEVIMSVMKTHQKYIPVEDHKGRLMPYFVGVSNNPHGNKNLIKKGYERVLRARLEDAEFYYHQDIKQPLDSYVELLKGMVYNPKLGSLYDKTQRIVNIASFLCGKIKVDEPLKNAIMEAAQLCKADLATRLVSEFPELQGVIGKYYVLAKDPKASVAAFAIAEHHSKDVSISEPGKVVSLSDKMDTITGFFSIGEIPTGTQDPYGLRRAAISILLTIGAIRPQGLPRSHRAIPVSIKELIDCSIGQYNNVMDKNGLKSSILNFLYTRLEGLFQEKYVTGRPVAIIKGNESHLIDTANIKKIIDAVLATEPDDIHEADLRINFLKDRVFTPAFEPVLLAFKRVINISKNHSAGDVQAPLFVEQSEKSLYDKYLEFEPEVKAVLANRDYIEYIKSLEKIVPEINTFFDEVLVMSDDERIRNNRLNLLAKIKDLIAQVMDITKLA